MAVTEIGREPSNIKARIDTLFAKLNSAYPDKVVRSLSREHKKWAETCSSLAKQLGYPDTAAFLTAYGYTVVRVCGGRPKKDNSEVLDELMRRYPNGSGLDSMTELLEQNPDLKGRLKTFANTANERFGMSLAEYFASIGLLRDPDHATVLEELLTALKERYPAGSELPQTLAQLKAENQDLKTSRLTLIPEVHGVNVTEHLIRIGLLPPKAPAVPRFIIAEDDYDECLRILKQRYQNAPKPSKLSELIQENPDLPIRKMNRHIRECGETKTERFYIRNEILLGKDTDLIPYIYCGIIYSDGDLTINYDELPPQKLYYYRTRLDIYQVGDLVYLQDYGPYRKGVIREIIHCLGVDAPWPVSMTLEVVGKVNVPFANQRPVRKASSPDMLTVSPADPKKYVQAKRELIRFADQLNEAEPTYDGSAWVDPDTASGYDYARRELLLWIPLERCFTANGQLPPDASLKCVTADPMQIQDLSGNLLGELPEDASAALLPMLNGGWAVIRSVTAHSAKKPTVFMAIHLAKAVVPFGSVVAIRTEDWRTTTKTLTLMWTDIPFDAADAIFSMEPGESYREELNQKGIRQFFSDHTVNEEYHDYEGDRTFKAETWNRLVQHPGAGEIGESIHLLVQAEDQLNARVLRSIEL